MKKALRKWLDIEQESRVIREKLTEALIRIDRLEGKTSGLGIGEATRQGSPIEFVFGAIRAFEKRLGKVRYKWIDDPNAMPEELPQVREWYVDKKNGK